MAITTSFVLKAGATTLFCLKAIIPLEYYVTVEDTSKSRRQKLELQDELYRTWLNAALNPRKSASSLNGSASGHYDGYGGSFFLFEEDGKPRLVLGHVFEAIIEEEIDPRDGKTFRKGLKSGLDLARLYQASKEFTSFERQLNRQGFKELEASFLNYKLGSSL